MLLWPVWRIVALLYCPFQIRTDKRNGSGLSFGVIALGFVVSLILVSSAA